MTVLTTDNRRSYAGDGSTTVFAFPVFFLEEADVKVALRINEVETSPVFNVDYTVSGAGNPGGGTVTFTVAPVVGATVVIFNDPMPTQTVDYQDNDEFPAETHERALDKLTLLVQRVTARLSRTLQYDETESEVLTASDLIGRVQDAETARDEAQAAETSATASAAAAAVSAASVDGPALRSDIDTNIAAIASLQANEIAPAAVAHSLVPDADSTRDLGDATKAWATLFVDAIKPVDVDPPINRVGGTASTPIVDGLAKAMINVNMTSTPTSVHFSKNISSYNDDGVGRGTPSFTNPFTSATDVIASGFAGPNASGNNSAPFVAKRNDQAGVSVSAFPITVWNFSGTPTDINLVNVLFHGDLA